MIFLSFIDLFIHLLFFYISTCNITPSKKQKQKLKRSPSTKICKGCLGFNKIKNIDCLNKN